VDGIAESREPVTIDIFNFREGSLYLDRLDRVTFFSETPGDHFADGARVARAGENHEKDFSLFFAHDINFFSHFISSVINYKESSGDCQDVVKKGLLIFALWYNNRGDDNDDNNF
jgi:hypothetical protein